MAVWETLPGGQPSRRLCRADSRLGDSAGRTAVWETQRADGRLGDSAGRTAV